MFNIFKAVGDKVMSDLKVKAFKIAKDAADEIILMAKTQDLDKNGIKDHVQLKGDVESIGKIVKEAATLQGQAIKKLMEATPFTKDIIKIAGLYYLEYGPKRPSVVVAALEAKSDVA